MTDQTNVQQAAALIAGTVAAVAETADPALVAKTQAVVAHGVNTFESHNPELAPLVTTGTAIAENLAAEHGWAAVLATIEAFLGWHASIPHAAVVTPTA